MYLEAFTSSQGVSWHDFWDDPDVRSVVADEWYDSEPLKKYVLVDFSGGKNFLPVLVYSDTKFSPDFKLTSEVVRDERVDPFTTPGTGQYWRNEHLDHLEFIYSKIPSLRSKWGGYKTKSGVVDPIDTGYLPSVTAISAVTETQVTTRPVADVVNPPSGRNTVPVLTIPPGGSNTVITIPPRTKPLGETKVQVSDTFLIVGMIGAAIFFLNKKKRS